MKRATMRDVALASGVSATTVSFVFNKTPGQTISDETRQRVLRAGESLGYRPHSVARALREGATRILLVHVGELPHAPGLDDFMNGFEGEANDQGVAVVMTSGRRSAKATAVEALRPRAVLDLDEMYEATSSTLPTSVPEGGWIDGLASQYFEQFSYLAQEGHTRVAVAVPIRAGQPVRDIFTSYMTAAASRLGMDTTRVIEVDLADPQGAGSNLFPVMASGATAVAALDDQTALGVLACAHDQGIAVPDQLSVIGWGDSPEGRAWRPALTSVRVDTHTHGRRMARRLLELPYADIVPASACVVRRSTT